VASTRRAEEEEVCILCRRGGGAPRVGPARQPHAHADACESGRRSACAGLLPPGRAAASTHRDSRGRSRTSSWSASSPPALCVPWWEHALRSQRRKGLRHSGGVRGHGGGAHRGGEQAAGCVCARRPGPSPPGAPGAPPAIPRTHPRARAAVRTIPAHAGPRGRRSSSRRRPCGVTRAAVTEPPALPKPGRRRLPYRPSPAPPPPARAPADPRAAFCRRAARGARAVHVVCVSLCVCVCTRVYHPAGASLRESERVRGVLCSSLAVAHDVRVAGRPGHARGAG
jgi:hypothetical protein